MGSKAADRSFPPQSETTIKTILRKFRYRPPSPFKPLNCISMNCHVIQRFDIYLCSKLFRLSDIFPSHAAAANFEYKIIINPVCRLVHVGPLSRDVKACR